MLLEFSLQIRIQNAYKISLDKTSDPVVAVGSNYFCFTYFEEYFPSDGKILHSSNPIYIGLKYFALKKIKVVGVSKLTQFESCIIIKVVFYFVHDR